MDTMRRRGLAATAVGLAAGLVPSSRLRAQPPWPGTRPVTLVVGYPPGGSVDLVARTVAEPLGRRLGVPVVVENVGGAGGTLGAQRVVAAAPDGHTLLLGSGSEVSIARLFNPAVRYDGRTDLAHVGLIGVTPMVLVAGPSAGVRTLDEALARARRTDLSSNFASSGVGTPLHVAGELVNLLAGTRFNHVPYRGAAQMVADVVGGSIEFSVFVLSSALPHVESGKLVALGVTTAARSRAAPGIASLAEHPRLKDYDMNVWFGLFGPARLPEPIVTRLNRELNDVLREPAVVAALQKAGITHDGGTPAALTAFIQAETERVARVVERVGAAGAVR